MGMDQNQGHHWRKIIGIKTAPKSLFSSGLFNGNIALFDIIPSPRLKLLIELDYPLEGLKPSHRKPAWPLPFSPATA
ncbi:hypothetical protein FPZ49_28665 [Paenibacillus cremeus]|uniref:Uncharacterized protein n=1 Tax=Paenibacillus cremeus TaxID=2163881 RepID=A0A559K366_9BACL|nr:hypothetical protein FPZ49_28665 [Paenibacillus cremeus]